MPVEEYSEVDIVMKWTQFIMNKFNFFLYKRKPILPQLFTISTFKTNQNVAIETLLNEGNQFQDFRMHQVYDILNYFLGKKCRNSEEQSIAIGLVACAYVYEIYNFTLETMDELDEVEQGIIKLIGQKLKARNALSSILQYVKTKEVKVTDKINVEQIVNACINKFSVFLQMYMLDICYDKGKIRNLSSLKENKLELEKRESLLPIVYFISRIFY